MEHWITHNDHHQEEYELLAEQLAEAGKQGSAEHVREMIGFSAKANDCLRKALESLE
jgi:hypothetical protein